MRSLKPNSFFSQTLVIISLVSIGFQLILLSAFAYYMLIPLGKRAADDLASVIVHAAERWEEIDSTQQQNFADQMLDKHRLLLTDTTANIERSNSVLPYIFLLERSLNKQIALEQDIHIKETLGNNDETWFWVDIPTKEGAVRFGFSRSRIGVNPPIAFFIVLIVGALLVLLTSIYLTKGLVKPISSLCKASQLIGKGSWPKKIAETGPDELVILTKHFNKMNAQVQELLSNRTVLLSGIAHDLRTPLTQIHLALSMLTSDGENPELIRSIEQDLNTIDILINEALDIGVELTHETEKPSDPLAELQKIVSSITSEESQLTLTSTSHTKCQPILYPMAFNRIITNLITNAIRYGDNKPIEILLDCNDERICIQIKDNGPGIPEEFISQVFQPFYRLEASRNSETGGSGLGLAIVKQLAHTHNWEVSLKQRKNGGTNAVILINNTSCH